MLAEGLRHNPDSVQLYFTKGYMLFHQLEDLEGAYEMLDQGRRVWLGHWEEWRQREARGQPAEQPLGLLYYRLLAYMGRIAELQEETERAIVLYSEALPFAPSQHVSDRLHERIKSLSPAP